MVNKKRCCGVYISFLFFVFSNYINFGYNYNNYTYVGTIRITSHISNDNLGCNSVSWAPFSAIGSILEDGRSIRRLVTGSCDNSVRIWKQLEGVWIEEEKTGAPHTGHSTHSLTYFTDFTPNTITTNNNLIFLMSLSPAI